MTSTSRNTPPRNKFVIISSIAIFFAIAFIALFVRDGYPQRIINHFTKQPPNSHKPIHNDKAIDAWQNCLDQLHIKTDVVFFGDSLTRRGDFDSYYPDKVICNLGLGSDTISGMIERINMIESVSPKKVFIMSGINSIRDNTLEQSIAEYTTMLNKISGYVFQDVYVISVLPIDKSNSESLKCAPETIFSFNSSIKTISEKMAFTYVDLHSLFVAPDGFIKSELTTDGIHLTENGYRIWVNAISDFMK